MSLGLYFISPAWALDPCYTGSYYEPATDGEGITLQIKEDRIVLYNYAHLGGSPNYWVGAIDNNKPEDAILEFDAYTTTSSVSGIETLNVGEISLEPTETGFYMTWDYEFDISKSRGGIPWCLAAGCSGSKTLISLFRPIACN